MRTVIAATRYHDISCGHRVVGHEGACAHLHGHNYRITFTCEAEATDSVGRILDFGIIKALLCSWLDRNWDHKFLLFKEDPLATKLKGLDPSCVLLAFNPTAENLASHLVEVVGPLLLPVDVILRSVAVEETQKCSATSVRKD